MKGIMKVVLGVLAILMVSGSLAFSAAKPAWMKMGSLSAEVGLHYAWSGLGVGGGVEFMFLDIPIADVTSLQLGATARGYADFLGWGWIGLSFGVGGMVTLHWSPRTLNLNLSYLENLDFYIGAGIGININGYTAYSGLGFWNYEGVSYFFNDNLFVFAEYEYYWHVYGGTLGLGFKI